MEKIAFLGQAGLKRTAEHRKARFLQYSEDFFACEIINNVTKGKNAGDFIFILQKCARKKFKNYCKKTDFELR